MRVISYRFWGLANTRVQSPSIEQADIWAESLPLPVQFALQVYTTQRISEAEADTLDGLQKAGFEVDKGVGDSGLMRQYFARGGGYDIDIGCSQLIVDGKIKVLQSPGGIRRVSVNALVLADGTELEADIVVLATGFDNMRTTLRKILGDKVADRCKDVWGLDDEGEVNAVSTPLEIEPQIHNMIHTDLDHVDRSGDSRAIRDFGIWEAI